MQLLMRLAAGQSAAEALAAPRWVVGNYGQADCVVVLTEGAVPDQGRGALAVAGLLLLIGAQPTIEPGMPRFVRRVSAGRIESATDPRADGAPIPQ